MTAPLDRAIFAWWWYFTQWKAARVQGLITATDQHADTLYRLARELGRLAEGQG